jgi:hypothetical protein
LNKENSYKRESFSLLIQKEEEVNDPINEKMMRINKLAPLNDPLYFPVGPITRAKSKKIKE